MFWKTSCSIDPYFRTTEDIVGELQQDKTVADRLRESIRDHRSFQKACPADSSYGGISSRGRPW